MRMRSTILAAALGAVVIGTGCAGGPLTQRERGVLGGGALGAGTGAIIGAAVGHTWEGAAIGGGLGAIAGGVIGDRMEGQSQSGHELDWRESEIERRREREDERRRYESY
jgi:osmotically inducible lipoprotein OsmB